MAGEREVRTHYEGELRWIEASGSAVNAWQTASATPTGTGSAAWAPITGLIGYVQAGLSFTQTTTFATIKNRGTPTMHKIQGIEPIDVAFTVLHGLTAQYPSANTAIGPSATMGVSRPQYNFELKMRIEEVATGTGQYVQFYKGVIPTEAFSEAEAGDTLAFTVRFLGISGFNSTGFLA